MKTETLMGGNERHIMSVGCVQDAFTSLAMILEVT